MIVRAYYNEIDPFAAQWLRNLIGAGHIAPGDVDERDIRDVRPDDLRGYTQCHFFAGIGVWSLALRNAGVPDDAEVWTGSCPCQPFSAAGGKGGFADERHLWPHWHYLIEQRRPLRVFGEQVASKDGLAWFDLVQTDLEGAGYAVGAVDLCAAGVGAPHIRQRLWFVADAVSAGRSERWSDAGLGSVAGSGSARELADSFGAGLEGLDARALGHERPAAERVVDTAGEQVGLSRCARQSGSSHWSAADFIPCRDGKWRPVEPGTFPLAHGAPARVGRLRAYGNAIVAPAATAFIAAAESVLPRQEIAW